MKTALLPQNDNLVIDSLKENVGRSVFDLSHSTTFPIDIDGAILPICCIETVPSDSFEISVECLLRQLSPLKVPLMANFKLNTAFYYCQNRLAWKKWERFISGGRSGNEVYDIPRIFNDKAWSDNEPNKYTLADKSSEYGCYINYSNSLHTYFGISLNVDNSNGPSYSSFTDKSDELPIAFPFFDYQLICRDYYTNIDRLPAKPLSVEFYDFSYYENINSDWTYSNLFPPDEDELKLQDGIQYKSGISSGDASVDTIRGFVLDKVRYHNVRDDYFTLQKPAPMRGDVPEIDTTVAVSKIDFEKSFTRKNGATGIASDTYYKVAAEKQVLTGTAPNVNSIQTLNDSNQISTEGNEALLKALNRAEIQLETTKAINAAELRLLSQLTIWKELNMMHKPYYNDFLNAHFNSVKVGESAVEKPQYIGGTSQNISINEILQTSQSTESSPLGNQGATAMSLANNYVGKVYCNDYGYIIGVAYIQTDMLYNPALPRNFNRRTKEDYYSPEFANLSMQATLNKEIFFSNDDEWNNQAWGYTGCFDELRSIPNKVAGDLLNSSYTDLKKWVIRREFDNSDKPAMNSIFLSQKDNVDKSAWSVPTMPAFMLQCANYIKAVRPLPYVAIPKAL